jgi:hypothetical protein
VRKNIDAMHPYTVVALRAPKRGPVDGYRAFYEKVARAVAAFYRQTGCKLGPHYKQVWT